MKAGEAPGEGPPSCQFRDCPVRAKLNLILRRVAAERRDGLPSKALVREFSQPSHPHAKHGALARTEFSPVFGLPSRKSRQRLSPVNLAAAFQGWRYKRSLLFCRGQTALRRPFREASP